MKICALMFSLVLAVTSSEATEKCYQKYAYCLAPLINNWREPLNCSLAVPFMECMTNTTKDCHAQYGPFFESYLNLTIDICDNDPSKREEWKNLTECSAKNVNSFGVCAENLSSDVCNATIDFVVCYTSMMQSLCGKFAAKVVQKLLLPLTLLAEACQNIVTDVRNVDECLIKNLESFRSCKLSGDFKEVGDICTSVDGYTRCIVEKSKEVCGEDAEKLVQNYTEDITTAMDLCKKLEFISVIPITECETGILECDVDLLNVGDSKCTDVSNYVGCIADASKKCQKDENQSPLYLLILQKYKSKFPDYCNKESDFNKNFEKKFGCINETFTGVMGPCYEKVEKDLAEVKSDDKAGTLRAYVNFLDCLSKGFGKTCDKEAESAVNDLLSPLEQSMDESCILLTGKKCNSASGLINGIWLLIASVVFLLTQKNE